LSRITVILGTAAAFSGDVADGLFFAAFEFFAAFNA
jgi:hypothetical protein